MIDWTFFLLGGWMVFLYFVFLWGMRLVVGSIILKVIGKIVEESKRELKEKFDSLKGGGEK